MLAFNKFWNVGVMFATVASVYIGTGMHDMETCGPGQYSKWLVAEAQSHFGRSGHMLTAVDRISIEASFGRLEAQTAS